jgi:hypothetical protein
MAQETFLAHPPIRDACFASIGGRAETRWRPIWPRRSRLTGRRAA